ncbi:MAG: fatty acid desaturase family protein [Betaproteobacteria bacterium]
MLAGQPLMPLSEQSAVRVGGIVGLDFAIIAAAIAASEWLRMPWTYVIAVMLIGARQIGLASIGFHDGAHGLILRNRAHNDRVAKTLCWVLLVPLFYDFSGYRKSHIRHHCHTNTARDPDFPFVQRLYKLSPAKIALLMLLHLSGLVFVHLSMMFFRHGTWRRRLWFTGAVLALAAGAVLCLYPVNLFLLYWIVPLATWGMLINAVRAFSEHPPDCLFRVGEAVPARDVLPSWFDSMFVATRGVNYHLTHHLFPAVPSYRLKALQQQIARSEAYRNTAHVTRGYHRAVAEILRHAGARQPMLSS